MQQQQMKPWFPLVNKVIRDGLQIVHKWHKTDPTFNFHTTISSYNVEEDKAEATVFSTCGQHSHPENWELTIVENALTDGEYLVRKSADEEPVLCRPTEADDKADMELTSV